MNRPDLISIANHADNVLMGVLIAAELDSDLYVMSQMLMGEMVFLASTRAPCEHMRGGAAVYRYHAKECVRAAQLLQHQFGENPVPEDLMATVRANPRGIMFVSREQEDDGDDESPRVLH